MSIRTFDFAYGRGRKTFELDDELILKEVRTETFPVMENVAEGVLAAIHHPIGLPSIAEIVKPGDTVAFICNDPTRVANSFDFMPVLVNEMNRLGVPDENMKIVFALGTHREMSHEEMVEQVGEDVASRLRMFNSIATKSEDFEYFGDTSRGTPVWIHKELCNVDHVILTGTIVHHGFGVAARQSHEGFARGVVIGHLGTGNILSLIGTSCTNLHGDRLILQSLEVRVLGGVFLSNEHGETVRVVRFRKVHALCAFFRDGNACSHYVNHTHSQSGNQCVKSHVDNLDVVSCFVGDSANQVNVVTHKFAGLGIHKFKRSKSGLRADTKRVASRGIVGRGNRERRNRADAHDHFF